MKNRETHSIPADQGLYDASLEWFRKSHAEHARRPSPNISDLSDLLEREAAVLVHLGKSAEASALENERSQIQQSVAW